jgi:FPC/CPF motif-containing protein YcgG
MMGTVTSQTNTDSSSNPVSEWVLIEWVFLREKIVAVFFSARRKTNAGTEIGRTFIDESRDPKIG